MLIILFMLWLWADILTGSLEGALLVTNGASGLCFAKVGVVSLVYIV